MGEKMFEGFDEYADEARERWGHTEAYQESMRRTKRYTKEDWARIKAEGESIESRLAELLEKGVPAESAVALAEEHRLHIDRWFYPCSKEHHLALGEMYVADARFRAHYDKRREGLAEYLAAAIRASVK
jgi:hypothetical protein